MLIAKYNGGSTMHEISWSDESPRTSLEYIKALGRSCCEIYVDGSEFRTLMSNTKGLPNLSDPNDTSMYFVGDWAKMIALNILNIF